MTALLAAAMVGVAVGSIAYGFGRTAGHVWNSHSDGYARWLSRECERCLTLLSAQLARRVLAGSILCLGALGASWGDRFWQRAVLGAIGVVAGYWLPALALRAFQAHRRLRIDQQLAPALTLMTSGLRAGLGLEQAIDLVVREQPAPIADEFALVAKEVRLGRRIDEALLVLAERLPQDDVRLFVDAVLALRGSGGDLSMSFQSIAQTIIERQRIEGRIRVMTAEGMVQAVVMCLIPPMMLAAFAIVDPSSLAVILRHPIGWAVLGIVSTLTTVGFVVMRRVVKVDV